MSETIITALIVAATSIICQVLVNRSNRRKRAGEEEEKDKKRAVDAALKDQAFQTRLARIEEKLDIHNGYASILGQVQTDIAVIKNDIQNMKKGA